MITHLVIKGLYHAKKLTGWDLLCCYLPISKADHDHLMSTSLTCQIAFSDYIGDIHFNPPKDPRLTFIQQVTLCFSCLCYSSPVFTDGVPTRGVITFQEPPGTWKTCFTSFQSSAQHAEDAFQMFQDQPLNLIVDTQPSHSSVTSLSFSCS